MSALSEHLLGLPGTDGDKAVKDPQSPTADEVNTTVPAGLPTAERLNWLRAGVLGANDGIVSVAATVVGVAGASSEVPALMVAGIASLVAGALSMAAGEYVSVSSQRDAEKVMRDHGRFDGPLVNPWHAAVASLVAFMVGGVVPLLVVLAPWGPSRVVVTFVAVVVALTATGAISAKMSGARPGRAVARNVVGGSLAMAITFGIGNLVGLAL